MVWVLLLSLAVHLTGWGGYVLGQDRGWWDLNRWPRWTQRLVHKIEPPKPPVPVQPQDMAMSFVDVSTPSAEAPAKAKYYSNKNSRAANRKVQQAAEQPNIEGHQTDMLKTEDVKQPVFTKNQAAPQPKTQPSKESPEQVTKASREAEAAGRRAGDLDRGKASPTAEKPAAEALTAQPRPRSLKQANAQLARRTPGVAITMPGGVRQMAVTESFDAKATPFGEYDRALVDAVTEHWYSLLDSRQFALDRTGKVTVSFRLNDDGSVTEVKVANNSVGELLGQVCADAIEESAPFARWPTDMREMVGQNYRDVTFTFGYY